MRIAEPKSLSVDGLILAECVHRFNNELTNAIAAMQLVKAGRAREGSERLIDGAIARLEGFSVVNSLMYQPSSGMVDAADELRELCGALFAARAGDGLEHDLSLEPIDMHGSVVRALCMIASELITNVFKLAERGLAGFVSIDLRSSGGMAVLAVSDDGPGIDGSAPLGTGLGRPIVVELARRVGGAFTCSSSTSGTVCRAVVPIDLPASGTGEAGRPASRRPRLPRSERG